MTGEMQSPDALISVIVPVYKAEQTLDRCVGSIVSQTYRNLEIILVDDGSPDDCPAMCDTWSVKDARIKVVHQKNGGVTKARNTGLACATGDLLAWVDSDDWIDQHYLDEMYQLLVESNADMAVSKKRVESNSACALVSDAEEIMPHVDKNGKIFESAISGAESRRRRRYAHASAFQMFSNHGISYSRLPLQHKRAILGAWSWNRFQACLDAQPAYAGTVYRSASSKSFGMRQI